ncbi:response regulator [Sorangium sp. So ce385]|uniref:response regulator n=1 Tax=Sorangium sp. So ce385 TaxID=3133308 RepID=UPI003F5BE011
MSEAERREFAEQHDEEADDDTLVVERRRRVLIVDDDPDFLVMAEAALAAHGFLVERAAGGLRGVFLATQDVPDVILCDLRMPGIDGFVVAEALRADPATQHVAIFACTGRRDLEARAALNASAFDGVLVKPVDWDSAARLLHEIIGVRRPYGSTQGT